MLSEGKTDRPFICSGKFIIREILSFYNALFVADRGFHGIIIIENFSNLVDFGLIWVSIIVLIVLGIAWNGYDLGSLEREAHGGILKLEMNARTWCMDRSIVTGPFLSRNSATGK
ncbi:hypothetical protein ACOSQ3_006570 [Xanthoceras sorbifolium]